MTKVDNSARGVQSCEYSMQEKILNQFFDSAVHLGAYSNKRNLRRHLDYLFQGIDLRGKQLLDVGGGTGLLSIYAAVQGATSVCIEPESDGSTGGVTKKFTLLRNSVDPALPAELVVSSIQDYLSVVRSFDVVVIANAINHLNEDACVRLLADPLAQNEYKSIFLSVYRSIKPGGWLVATDCTRSNFFNDVGLKSPLMPDIEWSKHQSPELWNEILQEVGFAPATVQWSSPNTLGKAGRIVLGNRPAAYFLLSHFRLVAQKPRTAA
jgi:2-polyprenyl-3-methyl-5-hydroxy-6-metoxy-1,4-benzoquinol methylase